jgi:hypothetical protein
MADCHGEKTFSMPGSQQDNFILLGLEILVKPYAADDNQGNRR